MRPFTSFYLLGLKPRSTFLALPSYRAAQAPLKSACPDARVYVCTTPLCPVSTLVRHSALFIPDFNTISLFCFIRIYTVPFCAFPLVLMITVLLNFSLSHRSLTFQNGHSWILNRHVYKASRTCQCDQRASMMRTGQRNTATVPRRRFDREHWGKGSLKRDEVERRTPYCRERPAECTLRPPTGA
jgi:hypothetical protein